jgi:hypothetical protein
VGDPGDITDGPGRPPKTAPGGNSTPSRPDVDSRPDTSWSGSQPGQGGNGGQGGQGTRPDKGERPDKGGSTRPDNGGNGGNGGQGGNGGAGNGGQGGNGGGHARPDDSRGNAGSNHGQHDRPDSRPGAGSHHSNGSHSGGHARPNTGHAPSRNHARPHTPAHNWYYSGHSRPIHHSHTSRNVYWYHGVWVYGPAPTQHHYYTTTTTHSGGTVVVDDRPDLPKRSIDRTDKYSLGVTGGQYLSGYDSGAGFSDGGFGVTLGYRPVETVGLELGYTYFDQTFDGDTERQTSTFQPSVNLYAVPWKRVNPYLTVGGTMTRRAYDDSWDGGEATVMGSAYGPHAGLGVEIALGDNLALDAKGTYIGYMNVDGSDPSAPAALQGTLGLDLYF